MVLESNCAVQWPIWLTPLYPFELAASVQVTGSVTCNCKADLIQVFLFHPMG